MNLKFLLNPGVRLAIAGAIASVVVFYFPTLPKDTVNHWIELALVALAGVLVRSPGDGITQPLTQVKPVEGAVVNPRPAGE